jgi:mono/diheme cytochrome c family protein
MRTRSPAFAAVLIVGWATAGFAAPATTEIIERRCIACHGAKTKMSGLDLSTREGLLRGGSRGSAVKPGSPDESLLFRRVRAGEMPPTAPLPAAEQEALRQWIEAGASWGAATIIEERRAGRDWWSLQALSGATPPMPEDAPARWTQSPVDRWVYTKLREKGLTPAPPADRRTLIRRVTFDMTGLPPSPEQVNAFVADESPVAYERLVDRLLASPHYGERWARHWLDVARFAESEGFERDWMRDHAWPYRDYVIRSFNEDKPYTQFAREQIAGDVIEGDVTQDSIVATGFLVSGPTDEIGLTSAVAEQRAAVREDQLEEMLGTVGQTFLGLTVNCARCHDHKFDPIPQSEYYALKANLEGVWQGERPLLTPAEHEARERKLAPLRSRIAELEARIAAGETPARARQLESRGSGAAPTVPAPIARWTFDTDTRDSAGSLHLALPEGASLESGRLKVAGKDPTAALTTPVLEREVRERTLEAWVYVAGKPEKAQTILRIGNRSGFRGAAVDGIHYVAGKKKQWQNLSTAQFRSQEADGPEEDTAIGGRVHLAFVYGSDDMIHLYRNGVPYGSYKPDTSTPAGRLQTYVRGDAEISVASSRAMELDEARVYDVALSSEQVAASFAAGAPSVTVAELEAGMSPGEREELASMRRELETRRRELKAIGEPAKIYAADSKTPEPTYLLERGDLARKKGVVAPNGLSAIEGLAHEFGLAEDSPDAARRRKLAAWIASPQNPLFARVITNRVWHYHFGTGIAGSPNDFGYNGGKPSHPELLDWLASTLTSGGWSLKKLHREILMSAAYRQSAAYNEKAAAADGGNQLLWRFSPRRLEGEAVRDAMLAVSGRLNRRMGGTSFRPFTSEKKGSLEIYTLVDRDDVELDRRTVYRMNVNSAGSPMLEGLDCPVPSVKTPKRPTTTTPLQALSLMNSAFATRQAKAFAERVARQATQPHARISLAFQLALAREPDAEEVAWSQSLVVRAGLEALCWGLFNASEFLYAE